MDTTETAKAYRRRAEAREEERRRRFQELRRVARTIAAGLHDRFGADIRVHLFGSLVDLDRFRPSSDIDLAVEGLGPAEYWKAWGVVEELGGGRTVDLVRLESATPSLRGAVVSEGERIP